MATTTASEKVRAARIDLAAAHRLAVRDGLSEGTWNHLTLTHPEDDERMLMTPPDTHWSQVTASSLLDVGPEFDPHGSAWVAYRIHRPVHAARPDARCVLHVHSPAVVALSMLKDCRLRMVEQSALGFYGRYAVTEEFDGLQDANTDQGKVMAEALGDHCNVLFLRNHGAVVTGPTVGRAYVELYALERTCNAQMLALATGLPLNELSEEQLATFVRRTREDEEEHGMTATLDQSFEGMKRVLDASEPDYRD
ncbi:MAG TPA: class II aldolase/adducin family protein [Solirubrobacterales bacterium]|nr:class II aldolase/adducin family protein [Solirubrobacterales bacterium]